MSSDQGWSSHGLRTISEAEWTKLKKIIRIRDRVCQLQLAGCSMAIDEVDHIRPVATHPHLQSQPLNLQGVCKSCHEIKSRAEAVDGFRRWMDKAKHESVTAKHPGLL